MLLPTGESHIFAIYIFTHPSPYLETLVYASYSCHDVCKFIRKTMMKMGSSTLIMVKIHLDIQKTMLMHIHKLSKSLSADVNICSFIYKENKDEDGFLYAD
uniref:Putative autophagy protein Atg8 ubiquitin-like protein n=1 Tax=Helianthus annuus TaxID=4232 RepID=A0A251VJC9_HELAN